MKKMTEILLLEGPDGCRYKARKFVGHDDIWWDVAPFSNFMKSDWWERQRQSEYPTWRTSIAYTTEELENTFTILAERMAPYYEPIHEKFVIHSFYPHD